MNIKDVLTFGYAEKEEAAKREFEQLHLKWQEWETEAKAYDQSKKKLNETISRILSVCKEKEFLEKADIVSKQYGELLHHNTSVLQDDASVEYVPIWQTFGSIDGFVEICPVGTFIPGIFTPSASVLFSSLIILGATDAWGRSGGVCTAAIVPVLMTFISYLKVKRYETSITEIKNALEKVPSVDAIKQQREKLSRLNDDLEKQYQNYDQGIITAEELCDSSKKLINDV